MSIVPSINEVYVVFYEVRGTDGEIQERKQRRYFGASKLGSVDACHKPQSKLSGGDASHGAQFPSKKRLRPAPVERHLEEAPFDVGDETPLPAHVKSEANGFLKACPQHLVPSFVLPLLKQPLLTLADVAAVERVSIRRCSSIGPIQPLLCQVELKVDRLGEKGKQSGDVGAVGGGVSGRRRG